MANFPAWILIQIRTESSVANGNLWHHPANYQSATLSSLLMNLLDIFDEKMSFSSLNAYDQQFVSNAKTLLTATNEHLSIYILKCHLVMTDVLDDPDPRYKSLMPLITLACKDPDPQVLGKLTKLANYSVDVNGLMTFHNILVSANPTVDELVAILFPNAIDED